jgi:hypothetical protein
MPVWLIPLLISIAVSAVSYLIMPKPKAPKPPAVQQAENPTAEAGKPIPVAFGTITIQETNVLWSGESTYSEYEVKG